MCQVKQHLPLQHISGNLQYEGAIIKTLVMLEEESIKLHDQSFTGELGDPHPKSSKWMNVM